MASLRTRPDTGTLFFDFRWQGARHRAPTELPDTPRNRQLLGEKLKRVNAAIKAGTFSVDKFFPEIAAKASRPVPTAGAEALVAAPAPVVTSPTAAATPSFKAFAEQWFVEFKVGWRRTYANTVRGILDKHLLPRFGPTPLAAVSRASILEFRAHLSALRGRSAGTQLSPARINTIMLILRQILQEGADRYQFTMQMGRLRPLKVPKSDVNPFTLDESQTLIQTVRKDYTRYLVVRIFTGMRSGEVNGLKWKYVDFERRLILVRETIVDGEEDYTKNDSSQRDIQMSQLVYDALREQKETTGRISEYVFCVRNGHPIDNTNFTKRVWYPLLRHLHLTPRRPYQMRHTAATLWLAAGEAPEWIARQLGHSSTEMLFRVYSRYVPNLTRRDGSAFDRILTARFAGEAPGSERQPGGGARESDAPVPRSRPPPRRSMSAPALT